MAARCRQAIDRPQQIQVADDLRWAEIEGLHHGLLDARRVDGLGAVARHAHAGGARHANGVGDLQLALARQAGRDDVLGDVAGEVRGRAVDLGRVLAGERAAAVPTPAAVGVDDDLAARETAVAVGAADDELAGRVDVVQRAGVQQVLRDHRLDDVVDHVLAQVGIAHGVVVHRADHDGIDRDRLAVHVAHRDLALAVRAQPRQRLGVQQILEAARELAGQHDRQRHQLRRLIAGVAEHQALVARALLGVQAQSLGDALADVRRLLADRREHGAGARVEVVARVVVADLGDGLANDRRHVDIAVGRDLARDERHARGHERFARHARTRVLCKQSIENGVGNLVCDLVGMAGGHGLAGEGEIVHGMLVSGRRCQRGREDPRRQAPCQGPKRSRCRQCIGSGQGCAAKVTVFSGIPAPRSLTLMHPKPDAEGHWRCNSSDPNGNWGPNRPGGCTRP